MSAVSPLFTHMSSQRGDKFSTGTRTACLTFILGLNCQNSPHFLADNVNGKSALKITGFQIWQVPPESPSISKGSISAKRPGLYSASKARVSLPPQLSLVLHNYHTLCEHRVNNAVIVHNSVPHCQWP